MSFLADKEFEAWLVCWLWRCFIFSNLLSY